MASPNSSRLQDIIERPTTIDQIHESVYRSCAILDYVEWLLEHDTPPDVVLRIMRDLRRLENRSVALVDLK